MGLRKFSLTRSLKKNFDFIAGVLSEIGLALAVFVVSMLICMLLVLIKPPL